METSTEEKVLLDEGRWALHNDDDTGCAYLSCEDDAPNKWCEDFFDFIVARPPDDPSQAFVVFNNGTSLSLAEYQQRHRAVSYPIHMAGRATPAALSVYVLQQAVSGACVLWSLRSWFSTCIGDSSAASCSRWYQNWWKWWCGHLLRLGMNEAHLRKAAVVGAGAAVGPLRFLPDPVMSTRAPAQ